jgi:hypothetical protein
VKNHGKVCVVVDFLFVALAARDMRAADAPLILALVRSNSSTPP